MQEVQRQGQVMAHRHFAFLASLSQLRHLELHMFVQGVPPAIWMLPRLHTLSLAGFTALQELPEDFAALCATLTKLELRNCGLAAVPAAVCACTGAAATPTLQSQSMPHHTVLLIVRHSVDVHLPGGCACLAPGSQRAPQPPPPLRRAFTNLPRPSLQGW